MCMYVLSRFSHVWLWPQDYSSPGSSVHGILQTRILEWVAIFFSRGSSQPRDWTHVSLPLAPSGKPNKSSISWQKRVLPLICARLVSLSPLKESPCSENSRVSAAACVDRHTCRNNTFSSNRWQNWVMLWGLCSGWKADCWNISFPNSVAYKKGPDCRRKPLSLELTSFPALQCRVMLVMWSKRQIQGHMIFAGILSGEGSPALFVPWAFTVAQL